MAGTTGWALVNSVMMPMGLLSLVLLMLPLPACAEKVVVKFFNFVFNYRLSRAGAFHWISTYRMLTLLSCCMLLHQVWIQHKHYSSPPQPPVHASPYDNWELKQKSSRWYVCLYLCLLGRVRGACYS